MATVLVWEPYKNLRTLYALELRLAGFDVALAASAQEALEIFRRSPPDILVMEIPGKGEVGVGRLAQTLRLYPHIPVIINTAYQVPFPLSAVWNAVACVTKSSDPTELLAKIRHALAATQTTRQGNPKRHGTVTRLGAQNAEHCNALVCAG